MKTMAWDGIDVTWNVVSRKPNLSVRMKIKYVRGES
jgi:hypothetical protein